MNDTKTIAIVVFILGLYLLYLHSNGRMIPLFRYVTNTKSPAQTIQLQNSNDTLLNTLGNVAITAIGGAQNVPVQQK